jgi:hypothetical protein
MEKREANTTKQAVFIVIALTKKPKHDVANDQGQNEYYEVHHPDSHRKETPERCPMFDFDDGYGRQRVSENHDGDIS